jgi:hypothetical protein
MALLGTGYLPGAATGAELAVLTRRAFVPKLVVQIYQATDYSGAFNQPAVQNGAFEADYNLAAVVVPVPFLGMEGLAQMNAAVVPLIEARMNDAGNQIAQYMNTQMWTNGVNGSINPDGFPLIAGTGTYGNIDGAANPWWQANLRAGAVAPTRATVLLDIISATAFNGGEPPNIGFMGPGTWSLLAQDFLALEQYMITPQQSFDQSNLGARAAFQAMMVGGIPIYMDIACPEGQLLLFNTRYYAAYIHEAAAFAFTGFASTLPNNQLGYIGALVCLVQFVQTKRKSVTLRTGYTFNNV